MIWRPKSSRKGREVYMTLNFGRNVRLLVVASLLTCLCGGCLQQAAAVRTNPPEQGALGDLRDAWNNGQPALSNWLGDDACSNNWNGVFCDKDGAVTDLKLANTGITGEIPASIGDLKNLESLELSLNPGLIGELPKELGNLVNLKSLSIQQCAISGSIPVELSQLVNLQFLALNNNNLRGTIPKEIGNLTKLYWFDISLNNIGGVLPISTVNESGVGLDSLKLIQHFHFNNNSLQGKIPPEIFNLTQLRHLLLDSNAFSGEIPNNASPSLVILRLDHNQLTGTIPKAWSQMVNLTEIHINDNQIEGTIPDLSELQKLKLLDTSNNRFDPQLIPSFLFSRGTTAGATGMSHLQTLSMSGCNLEGSIPSEIFQSPAIQKIDLSNNVLNGTLSFEKIGDSLKVVDLENNAIRILGVSNDKPPVLLLKGNPACDVVSVVRDNYCLALNDPGLKTLAIYPQSPFCSGAKTCTHGTTLHGGTCSCGNAMICSMTLNSPPYQILDNDAMNGLRGNISDLFSQKHIDDHESNLSMNEGQINYMDASQLWVEQASLTKKGRIDFSLAIFPPNGRNWRMEEYHYVSLFFQNNTVHLSPTQGPYSSHGCREPPVFEEKPQSNSFSTATLIGIIVGAVFLVFILLLIGFYARRQKKRADQAEIITKPFASWGSTSKSTGAGVGDAPRLMGARHFSVSELKKATNNFSERNFLGSGGYGKVYKALLSDGGVVAVKRAGEGSMQGKDEFKNEIELLSRLHHKNLVSLVGFCYDRDQREEMLIYEFMCYGTLRDHLLGKMGEPLTWQNRLNIALDSAKGLTYLHELANPTVIHRDIKSSNILLDERLTAKVADFGLSKTAPDVGGKPHVSTQVKGTLGYLDPEYYMTQQLTERSDVYSFGVVLLELLTARAPIENNRYIVREVRYALDKGGISALRPILDRHIRDCPSNELEDFLQLSLQCVEEAAKNRPTIAEVEKELVRICGHSFTMSVVPGGNQPLKNPYTDLDFLSREREAPFQYSGGFMSPAEVQPK